jgi:ferredoxin/flavodoxin
MKILLCYFSPTGNTRHIAHVIGRHLVDLGADVTERDITPLELRDAVTLSPGYDAFIIGAPIHSHRAPRLVREWLGTLRGEGKKAAMFLTYGGFTVHPAHHHTGKILTAAGFDVIASAEFLGKHTFNLGGWAAVPDRPDASDDDVARQYAKRIFARFSGEDPGRVGELPNTDDTEEYLDAIEQFRFHAVTRLPTRNGAECSMCMACEQVCPSGAMDAARGEADPERCIACLGCVAACPDGALSINDLTEIWPMKLTGENETEASVNEKKSKLYL